MHPSEEPPMLGTIIAVCLLWVVDQTWFRYKFPKWYWAYDYQLYRVKRFLGLEKIVYNTFN